VAVITMTGSCCPVTQAHIQCFIEARRLVLGSEKPRPKKMERFAEALGFLSLNSDSHVSSKLREKGLPHIHYEDRGHLVELATEGLPWMAFSRARESQACERLAKEWPHLNFVRFALNGADDVLKYQKWNGCSADRRFITMGRPGATQKLHTAVRCARIDPDLGWFIIGPELPDISSTAVRKALGDGDMAALEGLLHPEVAHWCLSYSPYKPKVAVPVVKPMEEDIAQRCCSNWFYRRTSPRSVVVDA